MPKKTNKIEYKLTPRDLEILKEIIQDHFLTSRQIQELFFTSYSATQRRLQKLCERGYLGKSHKPGTPAVFFAYRKAVNEVVKNNLLDPREITWRTRYARERTAAKKQHEIDANWFKIPLIREAKKDSSIETLFFLKGSACWDKVKDPNPDPKDRRIYIPIRPDWFFGLRINRADSYFFFEMDEGTMALKAFRRKLRGYREYYFSEGFLNRYGQKGARKEDYPFRVLTAVKQTVAQPSDERRNNLVEQAIAEGSLLMCWFANFQETVSNPFDKIWIRGKEYKEILESLPPQQRERISKASSTIERDRLIKEKVRRYSIKEGV